VRISMGGELFTDLSGQVLDLLDEAVERGH
jgi:hypothetical protein